MRNGTKSETPGPSYGARVRALRFFGIIALGMGLVLTAHWARGEPNDVNIVVIKDMPYVEKAGDVTTLAILAFLQRFGVKKSAIRN